MSGLTQVWRREKRAHRLKSDFAFRRLWPRVFLGCGKNVCQPCARMLRKFVKVAINCRIGGLSSSLTRLLTTGGIALNIPGALSNVARAGTLVSP